VPVTAIPDADLVDVEEESTPSSFDQKDKGKGVFSRIRNRFRKF
jgi:hypothetical protein